MIDWLQFDLPYRSGVVGDTVLKQKFGEDIPKRFLTGTSVEGSWSGKMFVRSTGSYLSISGNPVKFLTGQNVVGINCARTLARETYRRIIDLLDIPDCIFARRALADDEFTIKRVDATFHYRVGSDEDVTAWLAAMEEGSEVKNRGRGSYRAKEQTLYFGMSKDENGKAKGSRRSMFKFYNKLAELRKHPMTCDPGFRDLLTDIARGIVRGEATFRSLELQRLYYDAQGVLGGASEPQGLHSLEHFRNWNLGTCYDLHERWIDNMTIAESVRLRADDEMALPRSLLSTYLHWKSGHVMQDILSKSQFYRHRAALLEFGVNIAIPPRGLEGKKEEVVPVLRVLEAKPVDETEYEEIFWSLMKCG